MSNSNFDSILISKKVMIDCIVNKYRVAFLTKEDLLQEARSVVWKLYLRNPTLMKHNAYIGKSIENRISDLIKERVVKDVYLVTGVDDDMNKQKGVFKEAICEIDDSNLKYEQFINLIDLKFNPVDAYIIKMKLQGNTLIEISQGLKNDLGTDITKQGIDIMLKRKFDVIMKVAKESGVVL